MKQKLLLGIATAVLFSNACKKEENYEPLKHSVVEMYAEMVYATYEDAHKQALIFRDMVDEFVDTPTESEFNSLKTFWAGPLRSTYVQTEAFRFYGGPIDDDNGRESQLNSSFLNEAYIDYVDGQPNAGIINDAVNYPIINVDVIKAANKNGSETNISTGYHAIEFLLWGQDAHNNTAGQRSYTDYTTAGNAGRRKQYLKAVTDLLAQDLYYTKSAWASSSPYRTTFTTQPLETSLALLLTGIGKFCKNELIGQRLTLPYSTQSPQDEHSPFSDQTHNDLRMGIVGIENVYHGSYTHADGTVTSGMGLNGLLEAINPPVNAKLKKQLETAHEAIFAIQAPFDHEIQTTDGRNRCIAAITAGNQLAETIVETANTLGIQISL